VRQVSAVAVLYVAAVQAACGCKRPSVLGQPEIASHTLKTLAHARACGAPR